MQHKLYLFIENTTRPSLQEIKKNIQPNNERPNYHPKIFISKHSISRTDAHISNIIVIKCFSVLLRGNTFLKGSHPTATRNNTRRKITPRNYEESGRFGGESPSLCLMVLTSAILVLFLT